MDPKKSEHVPKRCKNFGKLRKNFTNSRKSSSARGCTLKFSDQLNDLLNRICSTWHGDQEKCKYANHLHCCRSTGITAVQSTLDRNKPSRNFSRNLCENFTIFWTFSQGCSSFRTCSDLLVPVRMRSDALGCIWMRSDAFGCIRTL